MIKLSPTPTEIAELRQVAHDGPIVAVNLLKFQADNGREEYKRYLNLCIEAVEDQQAKDSGVPNVLYTGRAGKDLSAGEDWDWVIITEFPSIAYFCAMMENEIYKNKAMPVRENSLNKAIFMVTFPEDNSRI